MKNIIAGKKNTVFLFGAGAEATFGVCAGDEFAKNVLGINTNKYNSIIKNFYKNIKSDSWYPSYQNKTWSEDDLLKAALKKKWISEGKKLNSKIEFEEEIKNSIENMKAKEKSTIIQQYRSYMGILDERFHTIICPKALGPYKFWSVITCYWRAYFTIASKLLPGKELEWIIQNPDKAYKYMWETCLSYKEKKSYYSLLGKLFSKDDIHVITTNYTPLCESITEIDSKNIAYIHGAFKWFEDPKTMEIIDVSSENYNLSNKSYFPFIMLQSGIKPIINTVQMEELGKMISFLKESDKLVIVGYSANCDDNHINSVIRDYLVKGKEVVYFDYDNKEKGDILKRLLITTTDLKNFKLIPINQSNALEEFENYLSDIE